MRLMTERLYPFPQNFNVYYRKTAPILERYLNKFVGNPEISKDIAQDTFEKAFRKKTTFREEAEFTTWLYAIAKNGAIDYLRKEQHRKNKTIEAIDRISSITPEDEAIGRETETKFHYFTTNHKNQEAIEILLLNMQGYSETEIAENRGKPLEVIKSRKHRIKKELTLYLL